MTRRIGFLLVRHPPERKSRIMPEAMARLTARGAAVDLIYPDEQVTDLGSLGGRYDLVVLKSGADLALSLAGALEAQGTRVLNPWRDAVMLRDKIVATRRLQAAGVPVPQTYVAAHPQEMAPLLDQGPLVVKPHRGSQGRGVRVVRTAEELGADGDGEGVVFAQRYHAPDGPDRKIYCIGGEVFGVMRNWPPSTYEEKLGRPFEVAPELRRIVEQCGQAFGIDLFGVDIVISGGQPVVVDMQSFPGFKGVPEAGRRLADYLWSKVGGAPVSPWADELQVATRLAREAGAILKRYHRQPLEVQRKSGDEPVTRADFECNAVLTEGLAAAFPETAIFSEESADSGERLSRRQVWMIDPLDATSDFIQGGDEAVVSIGLVVDGRPVLGVVYNPFREELVRGAEGMGVTLNGRPAGVNDVPDLNAARLVVSRKEWNRGLGQQLAGTLPVQPVASMAYKLARVAAGLSDGAFSFKPRKEWGICAGAALVLAAGGRVTLLDGGPLRFNTGAPRQPSGMAAAGPALHGAMLEALQGLTPATPA